MKYSIKIIEPNTSYSFGTKKPLETKVYEIWLGYYHLGQGSHPPTKPEKIAEVEASSFKVACVLYEHQFKIDSLRRRMERGDTYIEDVHFGGWDYNPKTNSNGWTGRYFESEEEAWEFFPAHMKKN